MNQISRARLGLSAAAAVCTLAVLLPPVGSAVARSAYAEALQFVVLATIGPALLVLGAPWGIRSGDRPPRTGLADRLSRYRARQGKLGPWLVLATFMLAVLCWRLPPVVDAVARQPALVVLELVTLFPVGCALWFELVPSPPLLPRLNRPRRALFAAVAMWTIWILAYLTGFSSATWLPAYAHVQAGMSPADAQQLAAGILWAGPALCFPLVVYFCVVAWLRDSAEPDDELRAISAAGLAERPAGPPPPRGWRSPPARPHAAGDQPGSGQ